MCGEHDDQRWPTARHEAGHAVAAFHYGCPLLHVSIVADGIYLGAARIAEPEVPQDAVVLFCGPMAEKAWTEFRPGNNVAIQTIGRDHEGLTTLQARCGDQLSAEEAKEAAGFHAPILPGPHA
jgi:hypothetical protein